MIMTEPAPTLARLRDRLTALLGELERLGRAVAAAHVVAAIDAIEAELEGRHVPVFAHDSDAGVAEMARAMAAGFGTRAEAVARRQLDAAEGLARVAWAAIVQALADRGGGAD